MRRTSIPATPTNSWQHLRKQADLLGIPAWKLAEDYAFHKTSNEVDIDRKLVKS